MCGTSGGALCRVCTTTLDGPAHRVMPAPAGIPLCWAGGAYDGAVRAAILAYKERGARTLVGPLGTLLARAALAGITAGSSAGIVAGQPGGTAGSRTRSGAVGAGVGPRPGDPAGGGGVGGLATAAGASGRRVVLVPVPTAPAAIRARGGDHARGLAVAAARELRRRGMEVRVASLLAVRGRRQDSVGLDAAARRANVAGAFQLRGRMSGRGGGPGAGDRPAGDLVLVDDLVTTGATLAEAARVLAAARVPVLCAAAVAATERRGTAVR